MNFKQLTYPWVVWTLGATFFFYKYLVQVSPSVMTSDLMRAFDIHATGLGNLSAYYFYSYLVMQIPVGILIDKYSPRLLTTLAIFVCSLSTLVFSFAHSLALASCARALMGMGAAFAAVSCFKLATLWFSPKRFALVSGLCMTAAMLGAIGGQMPLSALVQSIGWRDGIKVISAIGMVLGVIYFLIVKDKMAPSTDRSKTNAPFSKNLSLVLRNKQAWLLSFYSGLAFAPLSVFGGLWGVPFLETHYHLLPNDAAFAVSTIFMGFAAGAPFLGWLSNYMGRRKPVLFMGTLAALLSIFIIIFSQNLSFAWIDLLLFIFGFSASGFFTCFAMIRELFPVLISGTVLGVMNTFDSICEALFEPAVGAVLDAMWDGQVQEGVHVFTTHAYQTSLTLLPISLLIAFLLLFLVKETHCNTVNE